MKKAVTFRLEEELIDRFKQLSEDTYISQTKLAELAITEYVDKKEKEVK